MKLDFVPATQNTERLNRAAGKLAGLSLALALAFVLLFSLAPNLFAQGPSTTFDTANRLYEQAKYDEAAEAYQSLVKSGKVSPALYFNWGNALFKAGKIGEAIYAYRRAEDLAPRDPDIRANLQFARNRVQAPTLSPDRIWRWLSRLTVNEWTWFAAACFWTWVLLLTVTQWRPALKTNLQPYAVWGGLVTLLVCGCFAGSFYFHDFNPQAIVVVPETTGRQAPLDESQPAFTVHDGAELQILDRKDQWLQVRVDARRTGWIRKDCVISPTG
jgi:tetratricopeptide (TPR) repeat protein